MLHYEATRKSFSSKLELKFRRIWGQLVHILHLPLNRQSFGLETLVISGLRQIFAS
jgi:hypothetical protein